MHNANQTSRRVGDTWRLARATMQRLAALVMLPLLILSGHSARAAEYCVGAVAELDAALTQAASPSQALFTTTIMLKQGTYHVGGSRMTQLRQAYFHALELLGGYNSDCSARTINPDNTVFDIDGATYFKFEPLAALSIEGIRFQNIANSHYMDIWSAAEDLTVKVRNNAFVGVGLFVVSGYTPDGDSVDKLSMRFVNNRVHGVPSSSFASVYIAGITQIRFTGNTVVNNLSENAVYFCADGNDVWLVDNVAWNNTGKDFRVWDDCGSNPAPGNARNRSNLYQSVVLTEIGDSGSNLVGTDPLFVNAAAGNYRLQNASPAVNSGVVSSSMADIDLAGNPRVVGSTVDRGAYESALNDTIPSTITVTTTSDSGAGSLRQAILDANANPDFNFINFNVPGACPRVIAPTTDLPNIVNGVRIDGWTQPGSVANTRSKGDNATRCIVLAGGNTRRWGLNFLGASDEQFWLQGLAFSGFKPGTNDGVALRVAGGTSNLIWGNQFGGTLSSNAGSLVLQPSDTNIELTASTTASKSTVGGDLPAQRNVIASAVFNGVLITSYTFLLVNRASIDNDIVDNLIGSYGSQITAAGNGYGIRIETSGNTVRDNTIINSGQDGIWMEAVGAHHNVIQENRIGVRDTICFGTFCSSGAAGNGRHGLFFNFGPHDNIIYRNTIRNNTQHGAFIFSDVGATSYNNWLVETTFYNNGGAGTRFSIYNGADNDADPAQQNMANRGRNYPVLTRAYGDAQQGVVEGTLSTTNGNYVIDIFSSTLPDSGQPRGEAEVFHKSFFSVVINNATPGQNGSANFSIPFSASTNLVGRVITVTATDAAGNSSELSAPVTYEFVPTPPLFANGFE
jgi:parallel beta-helix repeat protein